jgi:hypothetical protein
MKKIFIALFLLSFIPFSESFGQCATDVNLGQNLVVNGDFSSGYSNWNYDAPYVINGGGHNSNPGDIQIGTNPYNFNTGGGGFPSFDTYGDHTTGTGNFLMVDGYCSPSTTIRVWYQTVNVVINTNYYFSVWISSLKNMPNYPGNLTFNIGGSPLGANIQAPDSGGASPNNAAKDHLGGGWIRYVVVWNSGAVSGPIPLSIHNNNTAACGSEVDFGLDDIAFTPGCDFGSPGPQPDLGPDQSLCGKGGSILLNSNVPHNATTTVSWSDGTTGTGLGAPYTKVINAAGTYSVCVKDGAACTKSDVIVISNTFSINIGGPYSFCSSTSQTLDASYTGIGVTYKWYKDGVLVPYPNDTKTYTATSAGTYRVDVAVTGCATQSSSTTITSTAPVTPIDAYYCATAGPVSGINLQATNSNSSNLSWYTAPTGGAAIIPGVTTPSGTTSQYAIPTIPMGTTATQTYYVQDNTIASGTVGPSALFVAPASIADNSAKYNLNQNGIFFSPTQDFKINSVQIPLRIASAMGTTNMTFAVTLRVYTTTPAPGGTATATTSTISSTATIPYTANSFALYSFNFTNFNIPVSLGSNLLLKIESITSNYANWQFDLGNTSGITNPYPYNATIPNVVNLTQSLSGNSVSNTNYFGLFNWNISAVTPCSRTPVRAISNCVTPVAWTSFYLVPQSNACKLVWNTATETNNSYFTVERSSDGIHFETIGKITGAGNRDIASNYYYIDTAPLSGTSYYRITQVDYNGSSSSTDMKAYSSAGLIQMTTYPNPFQNSTNLLVSGETADTYTYTIYAISGQLVEEGTGTINQLKTIAENQAKGMYMLTVITAGDILTRKIVKQ